MSVRSHAFCTLHTEMTIIVGDLTFYTNSANVVRYEPQCGNIIMSKPRILNVGWSFMVCFTEENLNQSK